MRLSVLEIGGKGIVRGLDVSGHGGDVEEAELERRLLEMGFVTRSMPLKELKEFYLADDQLYKKIIREQKITID